MKLTAAFCTLALANAQECEHQRNAVDGLIEAPMAAVDGYVTPDYEGYKGLGGWLTAKGKKGQQGGVTFDFEVSPEQSCANQQNALDAVIEAPMVARDDYVWFEGDELEGPRKGKDTGIKKWNQRSGTGKKEITGAVKFEFDVTRNANRGKWAFQAEVLAPTNQDNQFHLASSVDGDTLSVFNVSPSTSWQWVTIPTKGTFAEGAHSISLIPRKDGTKVRAIRFQKRDYSKHTDVVCFKSEPVGFEAELIAPNGGSNSLWLRTSVDGAKSTTWHTRVSKTWGWQTMPISKKFAAGAHTIQLKPREDGTKVRAIRATQGSAMCFSDTSTPAPTTFPTPAPTPDRFTSELLSTGNYECDTSKNMLKDQPAGYSQITLTDYCDANNKCDSNPKYGGTNNNADAAAYCKTECDNRSNCQGFFFQKHNNGHEICGFYSQPIDMSRAYGDGHQAGAICINTAAIFTIPVDVEMTVAGETEESFTQDKQTTLIESIAAQLGIDASLISIKIGRQSNPIARRLSGSELLITVTIAMEPEKVTEDVETLESPAFKEAVATATGITTTFQAFKPAKTDSGVTPLCARCKWDGTRIHVEHFINAQKHGEKGLQHKCYHIAGKCTCKCKATPFEAGGVVSHHGHVGHNDLKKNGRVVSTPHEEY